MSATYGDGPATVAESREHVVQLAEALSKAAGQTVRFDDLMRTLSYAEALFTLCPFKPGDMVQIVDPPAINERDSWGWWRHLFVVGERCLVRHIDWRKDAGFVLAVHFEHETWMDREGVVHPVEQDRYGIFTLAARRFAAIDGDRGQR